MKFTTAWAYLASQNVVMRAVILCLTLLLAIFALLSAKLSLKPPLVVERGCTSTALNFAQAKPSAEEMTAFVKEALRMRFDTSANVESGYISINEQSSRENEQKQLVAKEMKQSVLIQSVDTSQEPLVVDADRLISVRNIRSAFHFPLLVTLAQSSRTQANPYGLILTKVSQQNEEADEKKQSR